MFRQRVESVGACVLEKGALRNGKLRVIQKPAFELEEASTPKTPFTIQNTVVHSLYKYYINSKSVKGFDRQQYVSIF